MATGLFLVEKKTARNVGPKKDSVTRAQRRDNRLAAHASHEAKRRLYKSVLQEAMEDCAELGLRVKGL